MSIDSIPVLAASEATWFRERYPNHRSGWGWLFAGQLATLLPSWLKTISRNEGEQPFSIVNPAMAVVMQLAIVNIPLALSSPTASTLGPGPLKKRSFRSRFRHS